CSTASISRTSFTCDPVGASARYFRSASTVPFGAIILPLGPALASAIISDPLMNQASALFGSAAIALSQPASAALTSPALKPAAQTLNQAVPWFCTYWVALVKAAIPSASFFCRRYSSPPCLSHPPAAARGL